MNKPAALLFVHCVISSAPIKDQAMIIGASAVVMNYRPCYYLGLIGTAALAKKLADGAYGNIAEIANNCAVGGLLVSTFYLVYTLTRKDEQV